MTRRILSMVSMVLATSFMCSNIPAGAQGERAIPAEEIAGIVNNVGDVDEIGQALPLPEGDVFLAAGPHDGSPGGRMHGCMSPCGPIAGVLSGPLALTDDQLERLHSIKNQFLDQSELKKAQLHTLMRHMGDALTGADVEAKKVKDLQAQINSLKSDLGNLLADQFVSMAQVLTPEQRQAIHTSIIRHSLGHLMGGGPGQHHHQFKVELKR